MKEENITRAKKIVSALERYRGMLAVLKSNNYCHFIIHIGSKANFNGYNSVRLGSEEVPNTLKQVTVCLLKAEFEQEIRALELELETL